VVPFNNITSDTQYTIIYLENQMGESHKMISNIYINNTFIGSTDFQIIQHQLEAPTSKFSSTNWKEATSPSFIGTNLKEAPTP
jgi:hypothetical protein